MTLLVDEELDARLLLQGLAERVGNADRIRVLERQRLKSGVYRLRFELDGANLQASMDMLPWEAALGAELSFDTLDGRILVRVPPGIQTGNRIRVAGKGYRDRSGARGDLYIKARIVNPAVLTDKQRELYEKLKQTASDRKRG